MGIAPGAPERPQLVKGFMQLYSVDQSRSQVRSMIVMCAVGHICLHYECNCCWQ